MWLPYFGYLKSLMELPFIFFIHPMLSTLTGRLLSGSKSPLFWAFDINSSSPGALATHLSHTLLHTLILGVLLNYLWMYQIVICQMKTWSLAVCKKNACVLPDMWAPACQRKIVHSFSTVWVPAGGGWWETFQMRILWWFLRTSALSSSALL